MMSKLRLFFLIILIPILFFECEIDNPIPEVPVNLVIQLNDPYYSVLNSSINSIYIPNEGYKGLIIVRADNETFIAYDAACTYDPHHNWGRVVIDNSSIFATDTVCGSKFNLIYGFPEEGPATAPLKQYVVEHNVNNSTLLIHN